MLTIQRGTHTLQVMLSIVDFETVLTRRKKTGIDRDGFRDFVVIIRRSCDRCSRQDHKTCIEDEDDISSCWHALSSDYSLT
jgi:hypothetical protein